MDLDLVKLLAELGAPSLFSAAVYLLLRDERKSREAAREADREALSALADTVARIDERTAVLVGDLTPPPSGGGPYRTPPRGTTTEYSHGRGRRGG